MADLQLDRPSSAVAVLTLNRPSRRNALSIALRDAVTEALAELATDADLRVVAVTGADTFFCAGFDLAEFEIAATPEGHARLWESSDRFHRAWIDFPLPTVAIVNGPALGGGFDLATLCDIRIATDAAYFAHPEHKFSDVVYGPLHDLVGGALARDLTLTGRRLTAEDALRHGLVRSLHAPEDLRSAAMEVCDQIASAPREVLLRAKAKIRDRAKIAFGSRIGATLDL